MGRVILLLTVILLLPLTAFAVPTVSTASIVGSTITITGASLGADDGSTTPLFYNTFEDGTAGQALSTTAQEGGSQTWDLTEATVDALYSSSQSKSGSQSSYALYSDGNHWSHFRVGAKTDEIPSSTKYIHTFYFRFNTPAPAGTTGQIKLARIFGNDYTSVSIPDVPYVKNGDLSSWWATVTKSETGTTNDTDSWGAPWDDPPEDTWHRFTAEYEQSAGGVSDGNIRIYMDDDLIVNKVNVLTRESGSYRWILFDNGVGMTNWDTGSTGQTWESWVDDAYAATTWQRVELCSGSTWSSRGSCTVQVATAWADTSITATLNQGGQPDGTSYIYAVDDSGDANITGKAVTLGASTGSGSTVAGSGSISAGSGSFQ